MHEMIDELYFFRIWDSILTKIGVYRVFKVEWWWSSKTLLYVLVDNTIQSTMIVIFQDWTHGIYIYICVCVCLKGKLICIYRIFEGNDLDILNDNVARMKTKNNAHT